jgi:putative Holliday junction resolvase
VRALGIDLGTVRVGLALSDPLGLIASPLTVLERTGDKSTDHAALAEVIVANEVEIVVVGLPLALDGSLGPAAIGALAEIDLLRDTLRVPVETYDERLTTVTADRILSEQGVTGRNRRKSVDKVAAAVILQSWLDGRNPPSSQ